MLSLLGCFGVTIESRGLLRVFMYLVFLLSLGFFAFGILALVQSSLLITNLTNKWNTIRRFLPPTFSGKYDKEQFKIFLETNLLLLGFGALCVGLLLFIQWYASLRLRRSIKEEAELEEFELSFGTSYGHLFLIRALGAECDPCFFGCSLQECQKVRLAMRAVTNQGACLASTA